MPSSSSMPPSAIWRWRATPRCCPLRLKAVSGILAETDLEAINRLLREPR